MQRVNIHDAKTSLSRLIEAIELGKEQEIIIARNGRPVAKLVPIDKTGDAQRIGVAKGLFKIPDDIDVANDEVLALFEGNSEGKATRAGKKR
jgi:prevent-host-death family protein